MDRNILLTNSTFIEVIYVNEIISYKFHQPPHLWNWNIYLQIQPLLFHWVEQLSYLYSRAHLYFESLSHLEPSSHFCCQAHLYHKPSPTLPQAEPTSELTSDVELHHQILWPLQWNPLLSPYHLDMCIMSLDPVRSGHQWLWLGLCCMLVNSSVAPNALLMLLCPHSPPRHTPLPILVIPM